MQLLDYIYSKNTLDEIREKYGSEQVNRKNRINAIR